MFKKLTRRLPREFNEFIEFHRTRIFKNSEYGLDGLDVKLSKFISKKDGYFVELGANNGFKQSNTLYFENNFGWRGLLIEPSPINFLKCVYYRGEKNSVLCAACVPEGYDESHVWLEHAGLMTSTDSLETDNTNFSEFVSSGRELSRFGRPIALKYAVEARTLTSCLESVNAPRNIDLLSLDVEGVEMAVLKGIDFNKYTFDFILVECRDFRKMINFMICKGYRFVDNLSHHDYLFQRDI